MTAAGPSGGPGWSGTYEPPEPRWDASIPLAERMTRVGRWSRVDPSRPGGVWSRWKWLTLAGWLGLLGGAYGYAWRKHGGAKALGLDD